MKLLKLSLLSFAISLAFFGTSYLVAGQLPEAEKYNFPESIGRHYAKATGGAVELGDATSFEQTIPLQNGSVQITELDIETTAVDVHLESSPSSESVAVELRSSKVAKDRPLLVDTSRGQVVRILTEEVASLPSRTGWMVFNFGDQEFQPKTGLTLKVPSSVETVRVRTVSGDLKTYFFPKRLSFQSESGDLRLKNPADETTTASIQNLTMETVSGDLRNDAGSTPRFQSLKFNSVSGDVKLHGWNSSIESVFSQTVSGDFRIETQEPVNATISFESTSGQLRIESIDGAEQKQKPTRGSPIKTTVGTGATQIVAVSVSGDFKIETEMESEGENEQ
jgi:hypothetical protein